MVPSGTIHNGSTTFKVLLCTSFVISYSPYPKTSATTDSGFSIPAVLPFPEGHVSRILL